ncbi:MAG: hypothetical protein JNL58_25495 [Planctomyces sp.]|nr:hypothetical protein [Planctomyces sp.]
MDRPQKTNKMLLGMIFLLSTFVGCAYHNMHGGGSCAAPNGYAGASGGYQTAPGSAGYPQGSPAPYGQPSYGQAPPPGSGFFGSGGY